MLGRATVVKCSKNEGTPETLFMDYRRQHRLNVKIARIFNTYGPRMHPNDGRVVSNFIMQALDNHPITIYGDGQQTRSFCFVDDLIEAMMLLMRTPDDFCGPVNIGNPVEFTMVELAEQVIALTGSHSTIQFMPLPSDDPTRRRPDIALARRFLGWEPKVQLAEGLARTIRYFRELRLASGNDVAGIMPADMSGMAGAVPPEGVHPAPPLSH
jgi:UDP-glucuronate decarboxylase